MDVHSVRAVTALMRIKPRAECGGSFRSLSEALYLLALKGTIRNTLILNLLARQRRCRKAVFYLKSGGKEIRVGV